MSTKAMKSLLSALGEQAATSITRPAEPRVVMRAFCQAMSVRVNRPVQLVFRTFPPDIPVSGLRLDCGDHSIIVVEEATAPEAQLVILGHELWHEEQGDTAGRQMTGLPAAHAPTTDRAADALRRIAAQILETHEIPRDAVLTAAARTDATDDHEVDAETFGLLFGREVRTWVNGRYAEGPVSAGTVEGRINLSLLNRAGRILR